LRNVKYFNEDPKPRDYIDALPGGEAANIDLKLEKMCEIPIHEWPWVAPVEGKLWKIRSGDHRLVYFLFDGDIVILHAIRKTRKRLKRSDIELALRRMEVLEGRQ